MVGPTITIQEAADRVERHIRDVTGAIPGARLEPVGRPLTVPCGGIVGGPEDGRAYASRAYFVRDVTAQRNDATFDAVIDYWAANGYSVDTTASEQGIVRATAPDGTQVDVQESTDDTRTLSLGAASPCVWPDGTPPPGR
jgi:hypothetical protein